MATSLSSSEIIRKMIEDARKQKDNAQLRRVAGEIERAVARGELDPVSAMSLLIEVIDSMIL